MFKSVKKIHFVGIGGIGMSAIAEILLSEGFEVSGSDIAISQNTEAIQKAGATVLIGHRSENIEGTDVVVYSSAVHIDNNPETKAALEKGIPLIRRAEMLAEVSRLKYNLAISGTHGKTTTTSMLGLILINAGIDPTVIVGGRLRDFGGTNARLGKGDWTIVEADEYDRSFLQLLPTIAIVNNIESEHLDIYKDYDDILNTFTEFANKVPFYGFVSMGLDDKGVKSILRKVNKKVVTFGLNKNADYRADNIVQNAMNLHCKVYEYDNYLGNLEINIPGIHNLKNALAAISVARKMDIDKETIFKSLKEFKGVYRRFDIRGEKNNILVVDDYAHHPTEVKSCLNAATGFNRRIVAAFQPHTYTRTRDLYKEFAQSFDEADVLIVTDVYPARETPIEGIDGKIIVNECIAMGHKNVVYIPTVNELKDKIKEILKPGDLFITIGAGNICDVAEYICNN
ncbi:MAG TPA: UDP-N-acetylmuramate--L-alanine ligase [Candidatus Kapabacteria bacterium]|nr:UDP-N-acetylmuramate--L-alanine ligase [Candidatus Kapabacteria bacterium]